MKKSLTIAAAIALMAPAMASAQNLLAGKSVQLFGEAKTWTKIVNDAEETFTVNVEDLQKLTVEPQNTSNVFLFPETGGGWATDENKAIGIQGFYVDLEESTAIGTVSTTWEGAAANAYNIYVTEDVPTTALLEGEATYSATGLGQYTANTAVLPEGTKGRYVVFQPTDATNWGWGVKIRSISAAAPQEFELTSFTVSPLFIASENTEMTFTFTDQFGRAMNESAITLTTSDNATLIDGKMTIVSGNEATIYATAGDVTLQVVVYAATAPAAISNTVNVAVYTPEVTNLGTVTDWNEKANQGEQINFADGEVAMPFTEAGCIFITNPTTLGAWDFNKPVSELGNTLHLDIFSANDCTARVGFQDDQQFWHSAELKAGEWSSINVNVADNGGVKDNNDTVRFIQLRFNPFAEILLANVYFFDDKSVPTGVSAVAEVEGAVNVYNMQGVLLKENVNAAEALEGLAKGMYVVGNKKVVK